jgi:hypothetical protein
MEIEGLQLAIGAVLDILFIMLSNFSKVSLINVEDCILISLLGFFFCWLGDWHAKLERLLK